MNYLLILTTLIIFTLVINKLFKNTNFYKNKFIDTHKFKDMPNNLEIVNLGSNQPKFAFDYSQSNILGMNWAVGPQTLEYDFRILKDFHNNLKPNSKILIAISPFQFFLFNYKNNASNHKYYNFLDSNLIDNYSNLTKKLYLDYPVFTAKKQILRIIKDTKPDVRLELENNPMNAKEIQKDAMEWLDGWKRQFQVNDLENIILSDENKYNIDKNIEILKEMIDFCIEREYEPVLLVLPVTKELSALFPDAFVQKYIMDCINQANQKNVKFLNYWKDERFEENELCFDSFFMNSVGRLQFTKQVLEDLNL
jgi:hypothetical protein